jgi:hypothetical protein
VWVAGCDILVVRDKASRGKVGTAQEDGIGATARRQGGGGLKKGP